MGLLLVPSNRREKRKAIHGTERGGQYGCEVAVRLSALRGGLLTPSTIPGTYF
jgi:hypothetical protein